MEECIHLSVDRDEIMLSYSASSATRLGEDILWSANGR